MTTDTCGQPTASGDPCQLPPGDDGTCHLDQHTPSTEVCGHPTSDGTPCQNPPTDGDSCWLDEHGGNAAPSGRPTDLTEDLIDEACELVADGTLVKDVWAMIDVSRTSWYRWRDKGREELEEHGEPQSVHGEFWARLMRAEALAREKWHRFVRDGLVTRKDVAKDEEGRVIRDDKGKPTVLPKRLDPMTREEIVGEAPQTSNAMKYLKARWPDEFAEKHRHEHAGKDGEPIELELSSSQAEQIRQALRTDDEA